MCEKFEINLLAASNFPVSFSTRVSRIRDLDRDWDRSWGNEKREKTGSWFKFPRIFPRNSQPESDVIDQRRPIWLLTCLSARVHLFIFYWQHGNLLLLLLQLHSLLSLITWPKHLMLLSCVRLNVSAGLANLEFQAPRRNQAANCSFDSARLLLFWLESGKLATRVPLVWSPTKI